MKRKILLTFGALAASGLFLNAQVSWDGGASTANWGDATNWSGDALPATTDAVTIDSSTSLPSFGGISVDSDTAGVAEFGSLTVDIAAFAFRSAGDVSADNIDAYGDIIFTSNFDNNGGSGQTFRHAGTGANNFLRLRSAVSTLNITNNGSNAVVYNSVSNNGFGIASTGSGGAFVLLGGSGGHQWDGGIVFAGVDRFGTSSGTLDINGGLFSMGVDLRAEGGTINMNASDVITDSVNVTLNDNAGAVDATINFAGQTETANVLNSFNNGGFLNVDGTTALTFSDLNFGAGTIDITGWSEGASSIVFTALGGVYGGTVADGAAFTSLTIGGSTAYMDDLGGGSFAVTAVPVPEPSTYALLAGALSLLCVMIRRRS